MDIKEAAQLLGRKGGNKTLERLGKEHYSEIQKLSTEAKKQHILRKFTTGDALNPITAQSIGEKLEQIELKNKN